MSDQLAKRALLIGTETYADGSLGNLSCTSVDTAQLQQVLQHPAIGAFHSVQVLTDPTAAEMSRAIAAFLGGLGSGDMALLYISGHGARAIASGGEFFFLASDTDSSRIEDTAVGASYVNDCLELCSAPQKVAILDCCYSGGYSLGMRTRDDKSAGGAANLLNSRGVYVVSSSGPDELSWGGDATSAEPQPSAFTGEVVDALRTGRGDTDNDGIVSVDELFHHVNDRMRARAFPSAQIPMISADKVNSQFALASAYAGPPLDEVAPSARDEAKSDDGAGTDGSTSWAALLDYYVRCLRDGESEMPLMGVDQSDERYVCLSGSECLLSGDLDVDGALAVPEEAADFVEQSVHDGEDLWYGYPSVVLRRGPDGGHYGAPRFAPLLIRRVQVLSDGAGRARLEPRGEPRPHPELARHLLGPDAAVELEQTFSPHWRAGMHNQLAQQISYSLREEFRLREVEALRPGELTPHVDTRTPAEGARNAAVLFATKSSGRANRQLLNDLHHLAGKDAEALRRTALRPLLTEGAEQPDTSAQWQRVACLPLHEGQEEVLSAAMTRAFTVATGPPGTGKSQLVANLVATAVANGQSVLVASTNNRAVDEVWQRCSALVPGSLIRTGSSSGRQDNRRTEREGLQDLLNSRPPDDTDLATTRAGLGQVNARLDGLRREMGIKAEREKELLSLSEHRADLADQLGSTTTELARSIGGTGLGRIAKRAERVAAARWFGRWRRRRFLRGLGWDAEPSQQQCELIARWADTEQQWRAAAHRAADLPEDADQQHALDRAQEELHERSRQLLEQTVMRTGLRGRQDIQSLLQARGTDWTELRAVLKHVRGWAVTNHSARRFPPDPGLFDLVIVDEASQCAIPQVLPILYRAKRSLIIGDPMQLEHVVTLPKARELEARRAAGVAASWLDEQRRTYHRHSAFDAFHKLAGGSLLLDEHFRCHPSIAAVSNEHFYGNQLTVLTDVGRQRRIDRAAVLWSHVEGRAERKNGGSWINTAEVDQAEKSVHHLLETLPPDGDVGVVTPFAAQAELLQQRLGRAERVHVGTVHRFQGSECDAIVFSLVAGAGMPPASLARLNNLWNLWNVAITRARAHLVVVGDRKLWRGQGGVGARLVDLAGAEGSPTADEDPTDDPLLMQLYTLLDSPPSRTCALARDVRGHRADALVTTATSTAAVLLDRGHDGTAPQRHLRLQYERCRLLSGSGGERTAHRIPAWRLFDDEVLAAGDGAELLGQEDRCPQS